MEPQKLIIQLTALITAIAAVSTGVPLIFMLIDAVVNKGDCFAAQLWDIIVEG